ncbi:hypothetical protein SAMN04488029_2820 [Reichenbachiella faecimaris]|uniref:Uncharacterized protein n=1 Tax=Reichenbachiella faecimaris TaxID=692418 RepID=A0A1W2GI20_REIFA|nr:hypothetical protein [Reichenbachiella faecimaris]SMD36305.1 hypothetical protein SAMN04488029_2820 [Reichenbachiella faecimaris]
MKSTSNAFAKVGASSYALWGGLNILAGVMLLGQARAGELKDYFYNVAPNINTDSLINGYDAVGAVAQFHAYNLVWIGLVSLFVAVRFNWKNERVGFWINLILGGFTVLGFSLFLFLPDKMPITSGMLIPLLWLVGLVFTHIGLRIKRN